MSIPIITPIIYPSSVEFWASGFPTRYDFAFNNRQLTDLPSEYKVRSATAQSVSEQLSLNTPLSLYSSGVNCGHKGKYYTTRWQKTPLPPNSFFKIPNHNIYIASPELTFLQASRYLSFIQLVKLGFDLCSQYYYDKAEQFGQAKRVILTTPKQLYTYAKTSDHMHGSGKAIYAAKFVLDSSNSPMETALAIIFMLPIRLGGYGMPEMEMNGAIKLAKLAQELMGIGELRGDLVWRKQCLAVEYNSKAVHNNDIVFYNDLNRVTAMKDSGWRCISVNPNNIRTFSALENIAGIIRKQLGLRPKKELLDTYLRKRETVYNQLFKY